VRWIFIGRGGWRAGWRFLSFFVIALTVAQLLDLAVKAVAGELQPAGEWTPAGLGAEAALTLAAVAIATMLMSRLERRSVAEYGLPLRSASGILFGQGVLGGFVVATVVVALVWLGGGASFHGAAGTAGLLPWAATMLLVGLAEELLYRGYALFTFATGMGFWPAAWLLSLLFGAAHLAKPDETVLDIAAIVLFGLFWCFTVRRTGSLWFAAGFHAAFNTAAMAIYAAPNTGNGGRSIAGHVLEMAYRGPAWLTGGACGLEASVFTLALLGALFPLVARLYPSRSPA